MAPLQILTTLVVLCVLPHCVVSSTDVPYAPHCNSIVPEPPTNSTPALEEHCRNPYGYFSGGDEFLGGDGGVSFNFPLHDHRQASFLLLGECYRTPTGTPSNFSVVRILQFEGPHAHHSFLTLFLHGYSSEISGEACMVGSGVGFRPVLHMVDVVVHLRYPKGFSASDALVVGTVRSLNEEHHPGHFKTISLWLFRTRHYNYTLISEAENLSAQLPDMAMETLAFRSGLEACSYLQGFESYMGSGKDASAVTADITFRALNGNLFTLMELKCSPDGRLHSYLVFSDSHPSETWISEGLWDTSRSRFSLVGCPTRETAVIPGDCSIGISLWFPTTLTIHRNSAVVGEIRSRHPDGHPDYFPPVPFGVNKVPSSLEARRRISSRQRYEFTRIDEAKRSCQGLRPKEGKEQYYSANWMVRNMDFSFNLTNPDGVTVDGAYAEALSMVTKKYLTVEPWYVSYNLRNLQPSDSSSVWDISAEGIYDQQTGTLCMVGCRSLPSADPDCEIQINIELPSMKTEVGSGVIRSRRKTSDQLYFELLRIHPFSSSYIASDQAIDTDRDFLKMEVEQIVYAIFSILSCVFLALQISHAKRHPYAVPSISILMVVVGIASVIIIALHDLIGFTRSYDKQIDRSWTGIVQTVRRPLLIVPLALHCSLLRMILVARSLPIEERRHSDYERKALEMCLPLYLAGFAMMCYTEQTTFHIGVMRFEPSGSILCTFLMSLLWFSSYAYEGFLLPQVVLNFFGDPKRKPLCSAFYVGTTVLVAARRLLNLYLTLKFHYYNDPKDILIPFGQLVLAVIIYLQQRS